MNCKRATSKVLIACALFLVLTNFVQDFAQAAQQSVVRLAKVAAVLESKSKLQPNAALKQTDLKLKMSEEKNDSAARLVCAPQKLRRGDRLTLKMKPPHGGFLEIVTPDERYIFVSLDDADEMFENARKYNVEPFFSATEFAKLDELKIETATANTIDYLAGEANGKFDLIKIFDQPGEYKIKLSEDSFEQDEPGIEGECAVELLAESAR